MVIKFFRDKLQGVFSRFCECLNPMGALTLPQKRSEDYSTLNSKNTGLLNVPDFDHIPKKQKLSHLIPDQHTSSKPTTSRLHLYPEMKSHIKRELHAPCRQTRFGFSLTSNRSRFKGSSTNKMGNAIGAKRENFKSVFDSVSGSPFWSFKEKVVEVKDEGKREVNGVVEKRKNKVAIDVYDEANQADVLEDPIVEEVLSLGMKLNWKDVERKFQPSSSSLVTDKSIGNLEVDDTGKMLDMLSLSKEQDNLGVPVHKRLLDSARKRDGLLQDLTFWIKLFIGKYLAQKSLQPQKKVEDAKKDVVAEAFKPLTEDERAEVKQAFSNYPRNKVLVTHKNSCIDITGKILLCLRPGAWLNDEVINVYLELLKEREKREPHKFLKCHFFNTFFYKKLISGDGYYNFQSVRRWTSQKKLGYCLLDCDKIFVPIHQKEHWCLAVINKMDENFQYLDSLGGVDTQVMEVLARYYVDEVKDKTGKKVDVSSWRKEFVKDLPQQKNGFDCGVFMIKYADFYSRGLGLCFDQQHMPSFRERTVKEILRMKAE